MTIWTVIAVTALVVFLAAGWLMTVLGLPGNWLILLAAGIYCVWGPQETRTELGTWTLLGLFALAVLGEIWEFGLSAIAARRAGGSRRAAVGALGGGVAGGVAGLFVGLPIPLIGSLVASVLFGAVGAMAGAFMAQRSMRKQVEQRKAWPTGKAAFWGRLHGTLAKMMIGTVMVVVCVVAMLW